MSDSAELRYLKQPPDPSVSAPDHEDNHNSRQCKPFEPPGPAAMSTVDRRKRQSPVVPKPDPENLPCPRCNSANTKFCYYNNNKLSQPRYFCRACRRYWTKGGILRDIPEGSGIARRYGRRSRRRTDLAQVAQDCEVLTAIDPEDPVAAVCEAPADVSSEGDQKVRFEESFGEPFLNGWLLGSREQGSEVSGSAGFEEMGFGRPV